MDPQLEKKWFVYLTDHHEGPFSLEEVQSKLNDGTVTTSHYVWCDGMADWQVMTEIDELAPLYQPQGSPEFSTQQDQSSAATAEPSTQHSSTEDETFSMQGDDAGETVELGTSAGPEMTETVPDDGEHEALPTAEFNVEAPPDGMSTHDDEDTSFDLPKLEEASSSMEVASPDFDEHPPVAQDDTFPGSSEGEDFSVDTQGNIDLPDSSGRISVQPNFASQLPASEPDIESKRKVKEVAEPVPSAAASAPVTTERKPKRWIKKIFILVILVVVIQQAISNRWLGPLSGPDSIFRKTAEQLVEWIPSLSKWVSPVPDLEDVDPIEYRFLEQAAYADPKDGIKTAVALSNSDLKNPHFYVGSNLPDFAKLEVHLVGIEDTLLNHYDVHIVENVIIKNHWGRTKSVSYDGNPIPAGEYEVFVFEADTQERSVQEVLNLISPSNAPIADGLPTGKRIVFKKKYFLGGTKDDQYEKRLKAFHDRLQAKAKSEIAGLKSIVSQIKSHTDSLFGNFEKLRKGTPPGKARRDWEQFDRQWRSSLVSLEATAQKWNNTSALRTQYYGRVYQIVADLVPALKRVEAKLGTYFTKPPRDLKQFEIDYSHDKSRFETSIATLQAVVERIEKTQPSPNGMPVRLPLKETGNTGA